ncbi:DNA polymerase III subunit gamma/tau [Comamonas composti]|uniref:DNA polymerase III subunit gamma/tau n=1 Tax=Comamonas composti TaxID=408558 RepID=UPI00040E2FB1|nr:DNA polymerase III subunit gamma/tau [Comamonas composti]
MSYLVLARKYRPRNFSEMVGQEHVVQALTNALTQQRLHHAYLFTGTRGVGKTTVSRILAKSLNCQGADGQGGITATPCGVCAACTEIDSGRFPDYTELDAASNRGVDEVQGLLEQAVYKPVQGRFKVFMIDEVHMLTNTAFNAMLKTLEEPPEYLKFVLATTDPQKVPVTVLSRCLQFNLRPMAPETVFEHLGHVLQSEAIAAEPQALRLLSRAARGSMRDALSLTDQAIAFGSGQLQEALVRQMLGSVDRSHVLRLIDALARGDGAVVVDTVEQLRRNGLSAASTLEEMCAVLQRMAVLQAVPQMAADASDPDAAQIARLARRMARDETQLLYSICLHGRGELGLAPDEYAALTMALLRLLAFKPQGEMEPAEPLPDQPLADPAQAEKKTPEPAAAPARAAVEPIAPLPAPAPAQVQTVPVQPPPVQPPPVQPPPVPGQTAAASEITPGMKPEAAPLPESPRVPPVHPQAAEPRAPAVARPPVPAEPQAEELPQAPAEAHTGLEQKASEQQAEEVQESDGPPDDGAWAGMPDEAWTDDGRWAEAEASESLPPMQGDAGAQFGSGPDARADDSVAAQAAEPAAAMARAAAREAPTVEITPEGDIWFEVVNQLVQTEAITALARQLALQSQLLARAGDAWTLCVESASLIQPGARERLRAALEAAGHACQLELEQGAVTDSPARRLAVANHERQQIAEDIVHNHPRIRELMQKHGAKIVPGSIKPVTIQSH